MKWFCVFCSVIWNVLKHITNCPSLFYFCPCYFLCWLYTISYVYAHGSVTKQPWLYTISYIYAHGSVTKQPWLYTISYVYAHGSVTKQPWLYTISYVYAQGSVTKQPCKLKTLIQYSGLNFQVSTPACTPSSFSPVSCNVMLIRGVHTRQ